MIVLFAIVGAIQLLVALWMYNTCRRTQGRAADFIARSIVGVLFLTLFAGGIGTLFQACALMVVAMVCLSVQASPSAFAKAAVATTLLVIVSVGALNMIYWNQLAAKYPLVSLKDRLDYEARPATGEAEEVPQTKEAAIKLSVELAQLNGIYRDNYDWDRAALEELHGSSVKKFVNSPGFGVGRMIPPVRRLEYREQSRPMVVQKPSTPAISADQQAIALSDDSIGQTAESFRNVHRQAQSSFATSRGESFVKDIEHVAGFEPHGFARDSGGKSYELQQAFDNRLLRLDLVSLLRHNPPRVYVSKELPDMKALEEVPTRALDSFETHGLEKLRANPAALVAEGVNGRVRLLGSILAVKRCQECHRVQEGEMLGAFSYELLPAEMPEPPKPKAESADVL